MTCNIFLFGNEFRSRVSIDLECFYGIMELKLLRADIREAVQAAGATLFSSQSQKGKKDMKKKVLPILTVVIAMLLCCSVFAAGGWKINKKAPSYLTAGEKADFNKAKKDFTGVSYTPVFKIADQEVAGTNTAFFCKGETVTLKPKTSWKIVIVSKDLNGNASFTKIVDFDFRNVKTRNSQYETKPIPGGWTYNRNAYSSKVLPASAKKIFKKAKSKYVGVDLTALALLGTQVVNGTKYRYLCQGKIMDAEGSVNLYVVDVWKKAGGKCRITDCDVIDIPAYLG